MVDRDQEQELEWERGAQPTVLEHGVAFPDPPFLPGTTKITIARDDEFQLRLEGEGVLSDLGEFRRRRDTEKTIRVGSLIEPVEVEFSAPSSRCFLRAHVARVPNLEMRAGERARFSLSGSAIRFRRVWETKFAVGEGEDDEPTIVPVGPEAWRSDWFINGPHSAVYWRGTKRRRHAVFTRERNVPVGNVRLQEWPTGGQSNFDHLGVDSADARFAFCEVPNGFGPRWSHPVSIEFPAPVPGATQRQAVAEIVSFVVGRRLMQVGSSVFDDAGAVIESEIVNPWGQGVRRLCDRGDSSPFAYGQPSDDVEKLLALLVPRYIAARAQFGLEDALLTYWLANESFVLVDLALYSSAVESLKKGWFKSTRSKSKGEHMAERQYNEIAGGLIEQIEAALKQHSAPDAIARKVRGAYRMGGNEQLDAFFEEIGLRVGDVERAAIRARNTPAHGGISAGADQRKFIRLGNAYRALFERVFLKMLQYDGGYVDRTALDHPIRHIDEPCSGDTPA